MPTIVIFKYWCFDLLLKSSLNNLIHAKIFTFIAVYHGTSNAFARAQTCKYAIYYFTSQFN
ncbi:hypothetical protein HZS_2750 [Henneguya salminicola]|nr:hypothetical protein HZS_2750 [Henneguya salminicola]